MSNQGTATNYYEILEVAADAPPQEVHRAYQRAKATYSSDNPALYSMFSPDEARELLRLIEEAYTVLGNPGLRRSYDEARARGESAPVISLTQVTQAAGAPVAAHAPVAAPAYASPGPQAMNFAPSPMPAPTMPVTPAAVPPSNMHRFPNDPVAHATHQALPDFANPAVSGGGGSFAQPAAPKHTLPPGTGRTQLSTYKIDENFENELGNAGDWDGSLLQRTRLYKNISIDRLSEATRISRPYLMAVETNDFKNLPAAVFVRGFVVQMARVLGLNESKVAASYIKMFKAGGGK